jgi:hypothetical protein
LPAPSRFHYSDDASRLGAIRVLDVVASDELTLLCCAGCRAAVFPDATFSTVHRDNKRQIWLKAALNPSDASLSALRLPCVELSRCVEPAEVKHGYLTEMLN